MPLYPLLLEPTLHVRVWGGRRLESQLGKKLPDTQPYGEAWEVHDSATVINGEFAGRTLGDLLQAFKADLIGAHNDPAHGIPLLVKILDAAHWLSVQVHPNDEQAQTYEGQPRGKTEAWVVLDAERENGHAPQLVLGVKPGTTRTMLAHASRSNTLENLLVYAHVRRGDVLFIPAGNVHALGPGLLIYEVQQSSDTTYRLYDWGRLGLDGQPRTLHIDKAAQVANVETLPLVEHYADVDKTTEIVRSPYFTTALLYLEAGQPLQFFMHRDAPARHFHALTCIEGTFAVQALSLAADGPITDSRRFLGPRTPAVTVAYGQTVLIPACFDAYRLTAHTPRARALCSYQSQS
ncbi:MAG: class I mannose-6-phosphate isomerase [Chloroflexi bacterium]|nr:class I mannose-6-phosphate isomerase [Chloroflexota bacterium]